MHTQQSQLAEHMLRYISVFFQSFISSKAGKELTESHEREAIRRLKNMPSHHHYMVQPVIERAEYFRTQYQTEKERLLAIMQQEDIRFRFDYDFEQAGALDFTRLESLVEPV